MRNKNKKWFEKVADYCRAYGKSRMIYDRVSQEPYLERLYFLPRWMTLFLFRAVIHRFWKSDHECDGLHDHPWPYLTIVLRGGYIEHRLNKPPRTVRAGQFIFARAKHLHRIELLDEGQDTWTLFIMGPRIRKWGFVVGEPMQWVPWKTWCDFRTDIAPIGINLSKKQVWGLFSAYQDSKR